MRYRLGSISSGLVVLIGLVLVVAPVALASSSHGQANGKNKFELNAVVVSVDPIAGSLVVKVTSGTNTVSAFRGRELTVVVAADARLIDGTTNPAGTFTVAGLAGGSRVHLGGTIDRTNPAAPAYVAHKVILQWSPGRP